MTTCIDSLMYQGDLHLEIVLVDDGSTDLSRKIADEYAKKEDRIKVIHQENEGASAARNPGLEIAQGEYIAFLDSEDWISWKDKHGSLIKRSNSSFISGSLIPRSSFSDSRCQLTHVCPSNLSSLRYLKKRYTHLGQSPNMGQLASGVRKG